MVEISPKRQLGASERLRNEFPGSTSGPPKILAEGFIRRTWHAIKDEMGDSEERNILTILLKANLDHLSDEDIMEIIDQIKAIKARLGVKALLNDGEESRHDAEAAE